MRKNKLIIIPFNLPWEWSTDYLNQTAYVLGRKNIVICYMQSDLLSIREYIERRKFPILLRKYSKNIYQYYPIFFVPLRRSFLISKLNEEINILLLKLLIAILTLKNNFSVRIFWVFDPLYGYLVKYFTNGYIKIYDCVDFFAGAAKNSLAKKAALENEKQLVNNVDNVFANSLVLKDRLATYREDVVLVSQGFRLDTFVKNKTKNLPLLKRGNRPLIGFVGAVNSRINYNLLFNLAKKHPEWDFAVWGKVLEDSQFTGKQRLLLTKLEKLKNVLRGQSAKEEIPGIVKQFDIGMIPYDPGNDFNKYCYPMKIFEFFYFGKPVISTTIIELRRFPDLVRMSDNLKDWERIIKSLLNSPWPNALKNKAKRLSIENSWQNKVNQILKKLN